MNRKHRLLVLLAVALPGLLLDRLSKRWAQGPLCAVGGSAQVWPGVFGWVYAENTGMAFSALSDSTSLLALTSLLLVLGVLFYLFCAREVPPTGALGLSMIAAGGAGNLFDRLVYGYVVDFIHPEFMRFAIFNVADILVCCGAGLCILALLFGSRTERQSRA